MSDNFILIHPQTPHSLQHSQCCVGVQSLGKLTRSLGANIVVIEAGVGGRKGVSTTRALCLCFIVSLLFNALPYYTSLSIF